MGWKVVRCERSFQYGAQGSVGCRTESTPDVDSGARNLSVHGFEDRAEKRHVRDLIRGDVHGKSLSFRAEKRLLSTYGKGSATAQCLVQTVTERGIGVELSLEALCTQEDVATG